MEPMTLGSPSSPSTANTTNFLPSYLMGEPNTMIAPRTNTLSPTKGRTLAFSASSPTTPVTSNDFNRSMIQQRSLFGSNNPTTSPHHNFPNTPQMSHNPIASGPPTQSLFDSLRVEQNSVVDNSYSQKHAMGQRLPNQSFAMNQSVCDSYLNQSNFNVSRITSPLDQSYDYRNGSMSVNNCLSPTSSRPSKHWVTVYGFSPSALTMIIQHFSQCGTILEKISPPQSGNWVHLRFASSLECEKALNYHERILANSLMIGVTYCKDPNVVDKENVERNNISISRARPLAQVSYKTAQSATDITGGPTTPSRSSGIINKAIDLFFGL
ncbi:nucleoporin Nup35 [Contarinia nasturtii]|uniref:nucleoporin Nup35 n=1 Tax=Contarinia nasturtii TaxID=265458 RepID=UPI0012D4B6EE|nr:nucleoporin Nup35 [Contarinia nasturtii]